MRGLIRDTRDSSTSIPGSVRKSISQNTNVLYHTRIYTIRVWYIPYTYTHMV